MNELIGNTTVGVECEDLETTQKIWAYLGFEDGTSFSCSFSTPSIDSFQRLTDESGFPFTILSLFTDGIGYWCEEFHFAPHQTGCIL